MATMPRRTTRERLLYERMRGFEECLSIFTEKWRDDVSRKFAAGIKPDPTTDELWKLIEAAQQKMRPVNDEYRVLLQARYDVRNKADKKLKKARRR